MNAFRKLVRAGVLTVMTVSAVTAYAADQLRTQERLQTDMVEDPDRDRDRLRANKELQEPAESMKKEQLKEKVKAHQEAKDGVMQKEQYQFRNKNMKRENIQIREIPASNSTMRNNMMKR